MTKSIQHKLFFAYPPEVVWEYLTKAELMKQWLMPNDFQPITGCDFEFRSKPIPQLDWDGIFYCKVLEIVPFKKLTYSLKGGPGNLKITLDSLVEWTLEPKENGTELYLHHSGFKEIENFTMYAAMNDGWIQNMNKIKAQINELKNGTANS